MLLSLFEVVVAVGKSWVLNNSVGICDSFYFFVRIFFSVRISEISGELTAEAKEALAMLRSYGCYLTLWL